MSLALRPAAIPHCSACVCSYALAGFYERRPQRQQVRGKKQLATASSTVPVRLLKNMKTFGRKGAIVPVSVGQMRNEWFPRRVAEYVTYTERRELKTKNITAERDFSFGLESAMKEDFKKSEFATNLLGSSPTPAPIQRLVEVEHLTPVRSVELLSILLPPRLDFYRQPIEQPPPEATTPPPQAMKEDRGPLATGAAADLLAARTPPPQAPEPPKPVGAQAIYGSVSTHDVLVAVKASLAENDEASRVVLHEEDVKIVNTAEGETDRVKHTGNFDVELRIKGAEDPVRRVVRIIAQAL